MPGARGGHFACLEPNFGVQFCLHRRYDAETGGYVNCTASDEGVHNPDSAVHRFDRVHGFEVSERSSTRTSVGPCATYVKRTVTQGPPSVPPSPSSLPCRALTGSSYTPTARGDHPAP